MNPERVIPGQVVSADDDNDAQPRAQETFLHKVASGPRGPVGSGPAGQRAWTDASDPANAEDDTEVIPTASAAEARDAADASDASTAAPSTAAADPAGMGTIVTGTVDPDPAHADPAHPDPDDAYATGAGTSAGTGTGTGTGSSDAYTGGTEVTDADAPAADATVVDVTAADATVVDLAEADAAQAGVPAGTGDTPSVPVPDGAVPDSGEPLLGAAAALVREEWRQVQASFVDDPRASVTAAAGVVADAAARLESLLRERQRSLRGSWDGNGQADTEALRQLMLMYRKLLTKLIS